MKRWLSVLQALLVTFLWSTSFIIIKWGLSDIPPLTFAGLRYGLAWLCFLPIFFKADSRKELRDLKPHQWKDLILLGFVFYLLTQGIQFLGLALLPAVSVSLMLNFTPLIVALTGIWVLGETPRDHQWVGMGFFLAGILIYFLPRDFTGSQGMGIAIMGVGVLANAAAALLGRKVNREAALSPVLVTFISMGIGAAGLLLVGILFQGLPPIGVKNWLYLIWLAVINTAFAFTLWNHTLRHISAMESSIINGTMLIQIGLLAWIFLDERLSALQIMGMIMAALGALMVQWRRQNSLNSRS